MLRDNEEYDETLLGYIEEYQLADPSLPSGHRRKVLHVVSCQRELSRLRFPNRKAALKSLDLLERKWGELRVFHPSEHEGFLRLTARVETSIHSLRARIDEKFPG